MHRHLVLLCDKHMQQSTGKSIVLLSGKDGEGLQESRLPGPSHAPSGMGLMLLQHRDNVKAGVIVRGLRARVANVPAGVQALRDLHLWGVGRSLYSERTESSATDQVLRKHQSVANAWAVVWTSRYQATGYDQ
jgi:hypothetical protein